MKLAWVFMLSGVAMCGCGGGGEGQDGTPAGSGGEAVAPTDCDPMCDAATEPTDCGALCAHIFACGHVGRL